jgi:hypothetical protein
MHHEVRRQYVQDLLAPLNPSDELLDEPINVTTS